MKHRKPFTFDLEEVKSDLAKGMTVTSIATKHGTHHARMMNFLKYHGLEIPKPPNESIALRFKGKSVEEILGRPLDSYRSMREIQAQLGASKTAVRVWLRHLENNGVAVPKLLTWADERMVTSVDVPFDVDDFKEYVLANSVRDTSKHFDIPYHHVKKWCKRFGIKLRNRHGTLIKGDINLPLEEVKKIIFDSKSHKEIISRLGLRSKYGLLRYCEEHSITLPPNQFEQWGELRKRNFQRLDPMKEELRVRHEVNGEPLLYIAQDLGVGVKHLRDWWVNEWGFYINTPQRSVGEVEIQDFLNSLNPSFSFRNERWEFDGVRFEVDCLDKKLGFGVEFNGIHWHYGEIGLKHSAKQKWCQQQGIFIISILDIEWSDPIRKELIKSELKRFLGIDLTTVNASLVKDILKDTALGFVNDNSLMGYVESDHHIGLYDSDTLISVIGYDRDSSVIKIRSYATKRGVVIPDGMSKLLEYFKQGRTSMMVDIDLRYDNGQSFLTCGFEPLKRLRAGHTFYFRNSNGTFSSFNREYFKKKELPSILEDYDTTKTLDENLEYNGYMKVYDCGRMRLVAS